MLLLEVENAADYLRATGRVMPNERFTVQFLSGGVSNQVLHVAREQAEQDFVLKQARPQLRTPDPWFCTVERIWREVEVLETCQQVLDRCQPSDDEIASSTPGVLFVDRENYLFAMTAAPRDHVVWRAELLAGRADLRIAGACGRLLARLHAGTWGDAAVAARLADRAIFEQLRIEPYYEATARANPAAADWFARLIGEVRVNPLCLVHADFSPKNLLVYDGAAGPHSSKTEMMMVDFETGHYGDPAFDLGFFLSHLTLKAFRFAPHHAPYLDLIARFAEQYQREFQRQLTALVAGGARQHSALPCGSRLNDTPSNVNELPALIARGNQNLAGCVWSRLDGTSKIDYLTSEPRRELARQFCRWIFERSPASLDEVVARLNEVLGRLQSD